MTRGVMLLLTLQGYHVNSDEFNYNYGQAKAAVGQYGDAIEVLLNFYCSYYMYTGWTQKSSPTATFVDISAVRATFLNEILRHCHTIKYTLCRQVWLCKISRKNPHALQKYQQES